MQLLRLSIEESECMRPPRTYAPQTKFFQRLHWRGDYEFEVIVTFKLKDSRFYNGIANVANKSIKK